MNVASSEAPIAVVIVAAVAENGVIGAENDMPWRLSTDLKRFKRITLGKPVVMGRKTFLSLGKPLPGRPNVVITHDPGFAAEGATVVHSFAEGLAVARQLATELRADDVIIGGGGQIYAEAMASADRLEITRVHATPEGDTRFPPIDPGVWEEVARETPERGEKDSADVTFLTYRRRNDGAAGPKT